MKIALTTVPRQDVHMNVLRQTGGKTEGEEKNKRNEYHHHHHQQNTSPCHQHHSTTASTTTTTTSPPLHRHQHHQRIFITCNRFTTTTQLLTVTCLTPLLTPTWHTKEVANSFQAKENGDGGGSDVLWGDEDFLLGDERWRCLCFIRTTERTYVPFRSKGNGGTVTNTHHQGKGNRTTKTKRK